VSKKIKRVMETSDIEYISNRELLPVRWGLILILLNVYYCDK
jgi:hypothetical protein